MKLLNKSIRSFLLYPAIILLVAIPLFYLTIQKIVKEDVDESLISQKQILISRLEKMTDSSYIDFLQDFEPFHKLTALTEFHPVDSFFSISEFDKLSGENIPFRILESNILVKNKPYTIQIRSSLLDRMDLIKSIVFVMILLLVLIIAGLVVINRVASKRIWQPFYTTLNKLHNYRVDKNDVIQFDKTPIDEFTELNNTLNSLTRRNQKVYQSQKEFTENASHEMQTPLAIFQNKLELLMQTNPLSGEQAELIEAMANASQRMNRLNKNLLLLSKIDNNQYIEREKISIKEIITKLVEQYRFQADKKNITVRLMSDTDFYIEANKTLIEILLSNLISNAIRHNIQDGNIDITLTSRQIAIGNTGISESLDTEKLFQRFQKQTKDNNSTGLGLEIAKKIADLYQLSIQYQFENRIHRFILIS